MGKGEEEEEVQEEEEEEEEVQEEVSTHFLFMTRLLEGDMQLTDMSVVPCRLQIAMENRPKLARITWGKNIRKFIKLLEK